jgi:tetratricopeptide (TPR) repeat protein
MEEATQRAIADRRRIEADEQRAEAQRLSQIAEKARQQAEASLQKAREAGHEFFTIVSENRILDEPGVQTLREDLMKAAVSYYGSLENADSTDPKVLADVAVSHLRLAQIQIQGGLPKQPFATLDRGLKLTERLIREHPRAAEEHLRLAGFWHGGRAVRTRWVFDDPAFGIQVLQQAANIWEGLAKRYPTATGFRSDLSKFYSVQGTLRLQMGDQEAALRLRRRAAEIRAQTVTENPGVYEHVAELANVYHALALSVEATDVNEAEALHRKTIELQKAAPDVATYQEFLARHLHEFGKFLGRRNRPHDAIRRLQESMGVYERLTKKYPHVNYYRRDSLQVKFTLAEVFLSLGWSKEAQQTLAQASDEDLSSGLHHENARMWQSIANTACELEQWDEAVAAYAKAIELDPYTWHHICEQLRAKNKLPEAEKLLRQALAAFERRAADSPSEPKHQRDIASVLNRLGWVLRFSQPQEAKKLHLQAIAILEKLVGSAPTDLILHESLGFSYRFLVFQLDPKTKAQEREQVLRQAAAQLEETLAGAPGRQYCRFVLVDTYRCLADELVARERTAEAEGFYQKALNVVGSLTTTPLVDSPDEVTRRQAVDRCFTNLIELLTAAGRSAEAEQVEQQAIALYEKLAAERPDKPYFRDTLARHTAALEKLTETLKSTSANPASK